MFETLLHDAIRRDVLRRCRRRTLQDLRQQESHPDAHQQRRKWVAADQSGDFLPDFSNLFSRCTDDLLRLVFGLNGGTAN
ncbi:MAG: hypothetical protein WD847_19405 [Pirellulales bacterium]